ACHERGVPAMPGCFLPTEILAAHEAGADIVKVFPATMLGPQYIRDVRAPLPQVKLMPTGGVTLDNAGDWIRAGAVAVGIGSALVDTKAIEEDRFDVITATARAHPLCTAVRAWWPGRPSRCRRRPRAPRGFRSARSSPAWRARPAHGRRR